MLDAVYPVFLANFFDNPRAPCPCRLAYPAYFHDLSLAIRSLKHKKKTRTRIL